MTVTLSPPTHPTLSPPLQQIAERLLAGGALLPDSPENTLEVVGILKSYGVVLGAYERNLRFIAANQFLALFPFFKYFDGEFSWGKLLRHWWHDRINYEFAEYCLRGMLTHGGGGVDAYLDTPDFAARAEAAIQAKLRGRPLLQLLHRLFPEFLPEQVRLMVYYQVLGLFWQVMSPLFLELADRYDRGEITCIREVVAHIEAGLLAAANRPLTYSVTIAGHSYELLPASANLRFLMDAAVPYVEAVFLRSFPFMGVLSYNAQAQHFPGDLSQFTYGALYADPLPIGSAGIPPTLLMQDMRHYLPDYLRQHYRQSLRGEDDLRVQICQSFQKSMFCVTTAAIRGLAPHPLDDPRHRQENLTYLLPWLQRLANSRLLAVQ
ncbi:MAG: CO2 hydration protein [Thermostichales cyanobacterium DRC_bins_46]